MKVLVVGANGFIGRNVVEGLRQEHHEVVPAFRGADGTDGYKIDLTDPDSIGAVLRDVQPEAIVSCAGVIANTDDAKQNAIFTENLLAQVVATGLHPSRIIISGSAGEYGNVEPGPVSETTPLRPINKYGESKVQEEEVALRYREQGLNVTIARIFNPIGPDAPDKQLIPGIMRQLAEHKDPIKVGRRDSERDLVDVRDVASAIGVLLTHDLDYDVYNIGSGKATEIGDLVNMVLTASGLDPKPAVEDNNPEPEVPVASRADISRLVALGWHPRHTVQEVVEEVVHAQSQQ